MIIFIDESNYPIFIIIFYASSPFPNNTTTEICGMLNDNLSYNTAV